jgi:hypothetical protein
MVGIQKYQTGTPGDNLNIYIQGEMLPTSSRGRPLKKKTPYDPSDEWWPESPPDKPSRGKATQKTGLLQNVRGFHGATQRKGGKTKKGGREEGLLTDGGGIIKKIIQRSTETFGFHRLHSKETGQYDVSEVIPFFSILKGAQPIIQDWVDAWELSGNLDGIDYHTCFAEYMKGGLATWMTWDRLLLHPEYQDASWAELAVLMEERPIAHYFDDKLVTPESRMEAEESWREDVTGNKRRSEPVTDVFTFESKSNATVLASILTNYENANPGDRWEFALLSQDKGLYEDPKQKGYYIQSLFSFVIPGLYLFWLDLVLPVLIRGIKDTEGNSKKKYTKLRKGLAAKDADAPFLQYMVRLSKESPRNQEVAISKFNSNHAFYKRYMSILAPLTDMDKKDVRKMFRTYTPYDQQLTLRPTHTWNFTFTNTIHSFLTIPSGAEEEPQVRPRVELEQSSSETSDTVAYDLPAIENRGTNQTPNLLPPTPTPSSSSSDTEKVIESVGNKIPPLQGGPRPITTTPTGRKITVRTEESKQNSAVMQEAMKTFDPDEPEEAPAIHFGKVEYLGTTEDRLKKPVYVYAQMDVHDIPKFFFVIKYCIQKVQASSKYVQDVYPRKKRGKK